MMRFFAGDLLAVIIAIVTVAVFHHFGTPITEAVQYVTFSYVAVLFGRSHK